MEKIAIILLVNILFYSKTLTYKYCSDDIASYRMTATRKFKNKLERLFYVLEGRDKWEPSKDHLITMFIHALVCVGIYMAFGYSDISFLAAILFSFNPINNQAAVWISGRSYALPALGMLFILTFPVLAPLLLWVVTYCNCGFLFPTILLFSKYPWTFIFAIPCWFYYFKMFKERVKSKINMETFTEDRKITPKKFITVMKTFGFYVVHSLIPIKNAFYHSFLQSMAGSQKHKAYTLCRYFWLGLLFVFGIIYYWVFHPWNQVSFCLLWWCVGISPFLNLYRMSQEIAERYCYLPNVGLMFVLASILINYPLVSSFFIGMYATKMWFYMDSYTDDFYLSETSCINSPDSWFGWHVRAMKRWDNQSYREAFIYWVMALNISPNEFKLLYNIAGVLFMSKREKEGTEYLLRAEANIPSGQEVQCRDLIAQFRKGTFNILL